MTYPGVQHICRLPAVLVILLLLPGCWWQSNSSDESKQTGQTTTQSAPAGREEHSTAIVFEEPEPPAAESAGDSSSQDDETSPADSKPRVAIIIDDMGYHRKIGDALLGLDLNLSFAFLPHAPFAGELEETAYLKGSDILVHLPMEAGDSKWDPGPGALYLAAQPAEQSAVLQEDLASIPHAIGANNHMGSKFTQDRPAMHRVLTELQKQGLFFVDSFTTAKSTGMDEARKMGIKTNRRHIFLDNVQDTKKICQQLDKLAQRAARDHQAIAIGHPYQATLDALRNCQGKLLESVQVVPVHTLVR